MLVCICLFTFAHEKLSKRRLGLFIQGDCHCRLDFSIDFVFGRFSRILIRGFPTKINVADGISIRGGSGCPLYSSHSRWSCCGVPLPSLSQSGCSFIPVHRYSHFGSALHFIPSQIARFTSCLRYAGHLFSHSVRRTSVAFTRTRAVVSCLTTALYPTHGIRSYIMRYLPTHGAACVLLRRHAIRYIQ